jgi:hypothetical protein
MNNGFSPISWTNLKAAKVASFLSFYYQDNSANTTNPKYVVFLVDLAAELRICTNLADATEIADFEASFKAGATVVPDPDDALVQAYTSQVPLLRRPIGEYKSSGVLSASASPLMVLNKRGLFGGAVVAAGGAAATLTAFDHASLASGVGLYQMKVPANQSVPTALAVPIRATLGVTVSLTGTGANAVVWYQEG